GGAQHHARRQRVVKHDQENGEQEQRGGDCLASRRRCHGLGVRAHRDWCPSAATKWHYAICGLPSARTLTGIALWRGMPDTGSKSRSVLTRRLVLWRWAVSPPPGRPPRACAIEITPCGTSLDAAATASMKAWSDSIRTKQPASMPRRCRSRGCMNAALDGERWRSRGRGSPVAY